MINENLLSPKDVEINKLKLTIKKFKEYDEKRKEYYKNALIELGELQSYVLELEETNPDEVAVKKKIRKLKKERDTYKELYNQQHSINEALRNKNDLVPELVQLNFYKKEYLKLKEDKKKLRTLLDESNKKVEDLRKNISSLIYEQEKLKRKYESN